MVANVSVRKEITPLNLYSNSSIKHTPICLFVLTLYIPVNNFSVMLRCFLGWPKTKQRIKCLAQGDNTVSPVMIKPETPLFQVLHSTTEPLHSSLTSLGSINWAVACDFQQCGILTSVDSDEHVKPPFKLRTSKRCLVSSLTLKEYSSDKQRLWSDWAYAQADLRLCWSHISHCWKSHALAQFEHEQASVQMGPT